jgi:type IV secretory pathway TraG/TraD family ATPase VirD4
MPQQKVLLALDELANLGRLSELERGQSYLQGCGVQILQVWQNVLQCR